MAQKNRAQMLTDITTNIFNNVINFITGQNAQDRLVNLLDSSPNIISDKDQPDGYVGLDAGGNMFSSYYNENISRADLVTLLTTNTAVGYKLYQVNDAVGATKILLVIADSNITLYPFAIDLTTAEIGTYDINTDTFTVLAGSGNASIITTTVAGLQGLQSTSSLSTTTLYNVTDAVGNTLVLQVYAIANNTNVVYAIDVASGTIGTYNITTDTFTATTSTPDLQQVTDVGFTTTNRLVSDDVAGNFTSIGNGLIEIATGNTGNVNIDATQATASYVAQLPDKPSGTETFAMLSDLTGLGGLLSGTATQVSAGTYTATISGAGAYTIGDTYVITFATANDGASTININTQGAINIFKNTSTPISSGDIKANQTVVIVYDGTNFQAIGLVSNQLLAYVHNAQGSTINKGQVVYAFGASGNKMSVKLAQADDDATSAKTIGMVYDTSIAAGGDGYIIIQGVIEGVNTAAYTAGDTLYLSGATAGGVTNVKQYAPTHLVYVGIVERANAGNGQIYVRCQNGYELDEIHNVSAQSPADNNAIIYNSTSGLWEAKALKVSENTNGTAVTGTVNNTLSKSLLVPANTLKAGSAAQFIARAAKTGTAGTIQLRLYWNTTASLTGAILLATTAANAASSLFSQMARWIPVEVANGTGNGTRMFTPTTFAVSDFGVSTAAISTLALDWTVDSYLICAIQNGSTLDTSVCNFLALV